MRVVETDNVRGLVSLFEGTAMADNACRGGGV